MDSVDFVVNGIELRISATFEIGLLLRTDDVYATEYISRVMEEGKLIDIGLYPHDINKLEIYRTANNNINDNSDININNLNIFPNETIINENSELDIIWNKKGKATKRDTEAINYMLELRASEKYSKRFDNKKNVKLSLWKEMAEEMKEGGFNLGEKSDIGEKLRQKFSNLCKAYNQYNYYVKNTTGTCPKDPPDHYDQLNLILGDKHKSHPIYLISTMNSTTKEIQNKENVQPEIEIDVLHDGLVENTKQTENQENNLGNENWEDNIQTTPEVNTPITNRNRFSNINKTVKCNQKENLLQEIKEICIQSNTIASEQFTKVEKLMEEQNKILKEQGERQGQQRDRMLNILEKMVSKKRKRQESSDSE